MRLKHKFIILCELWNKHAVFCVCHDALFRCEMKVDRWKSLKYCDLEMFFEVYIFCFRFKEKGRNIILIAMLNCAALLGRKKNSVMYLLACWHLKYCRKIGWPENVNCGFLVAFWQIQLRPWARCLWCFGISCESSIFWILKKWKSVSSDIHFNYIFMYCDYFGCQFSGIGIRISSFYYHEICFCKQDLMA